MLTVLARHYELHDPGVDLDGTLYVRSGRSGCGALRRFSSVLAQTLGVWVHVSDDKQAANHNEAVPL